MSYLWAVALLCGITMVSSELGVNSNIHEWAYQWYENEPFQFWYQRPNASRSDPMYATWETPSGLVLSNPSVDKAYEITDYDGIVGAKFKINSLSADKHGVYICKVFDPATNATLNRTIFGINIRDVKYHSMNKKYEHNIIVAVIATAVFIVPLATVCLTYRFRYEVRHGMEDRPRKRMYYADGDHEMKQHVTDDIADRNRYPGEKGAYVNPGLDTKL